MHLNRPEVKNAFSDEMIAELTDAFQKIAIDQSIRVLVMSGNGSAFCAGADLHWMKKVKDYSEAENLSDSLALAKMMQALYLLPQPTIARVNGAAFGGGIGLVCACDIGIAVDTAFFAFSEVKLGLAPAVVSPFVVKKMGESVCRDLFLTGRKFTAQEAKSFGMVHAIVPSGQLDSCVEDYIRELNTAGPLAVSACKKLLDYLGCKNPLDTAEYTSELIANLRVSKEGQEGIQSFFEKRKPSWFEK